MTETKWLTARCGKDGRTCHAGIGQRRVDGPIRNEPKERELECELGCFRSC